MTKVAVVILNYNGRNFLEKFLPSVIQNADGAEIGLITKALLPRTTSETIKQETRLNCIMVEIILKSSSAYGKRKFCNKLLDVMLDVVTTL